MTGTIVTVTGPLDPEALGVTSMHEHVLFDGSGYRTRYEQTIPSERREGYEQALPRDLRDGFYLPLSLASAGLVQSNRVLHRENLVVDDVDLVAGELQDFKESGGYAIVDVSGIGLRTDANAIRTLSERTGVTIVASAGFYTHDLWPSNFAGYGVDEFRAHIVREIVDGIDDSGIRAGHIKAAVLKLDALEESVLIGATLAACETGAAVTVHPGAGVTGHGVDIAKLMIKAGMPPERLVLAHADGYMVEQNMDRLILDPSCWRLSLDYHRRALALGVTLSVDCFGHHWTMPTAAGGEMQIATDWQRLAGVVELLREGFSDQLVLGTDTYVRSQMRRGGGEGYCRLTRWVIPTLRRLEVADRDIRQMVEENPRRLLTIG
jgi:phosphotriesterase-related protein